VWSETLASQWPRSISGAQPDERQPRSESRGSGRRYSVRAGEAGGPILITYNGSPAALRALVLVTWLLAERRTCRWSCGRGDSDANCLRSRLSRDSRRPRSTPHGPGDHEARAETARWIDRTVGAIARGAGLETAVSLPQIAVSETIVRVACERDCCAVLVAARAPRPARHSPGRTVIRPASAACLRAS